MVIKEEIGSVLEAGEGKARVRISRTEECATCGACLFKDRSGDLTAEVEDPLGVSPGDRVRIETTGESPLKAAFLLFLLPLILMFGGFAAGQALFHKELPAAFAGLGALAAAYLGIALATRRSRLKPVLARIIEIL